jgi:hypothetical protein
VYEKWDQSERYSEDMREMQSAGFTPDLGGAKRT